MGCAKMKFLLRTDDFGWTHEESSMPPLKRQDVGLALAQRFHAALDGIPYLAGVIPAYVDDAGVNWLRTKPKGLQVALHGFDHKDRGDRHEFDGMSSEAVRNKIEEGHRIVGETEFYIPPFNCYSPDHVKAFWHEGIRYIFGREQEWQTPPSPVELDFGVKLVPAWARLYGAVGWQQGSAKLSIIEEIENVFDKPGIAVMTLHLPWESARDPEFRHTRAMIGFCKGHFISAQEFVSEIK